MPLPEKLLRVPRPAVTLKSLISKLITASLNVMVIVPLPVFPSCVCAPDAVSTVMEVTVGATVSTGVSTTFCTFTVMVCVSVPPLPSAT
ncbi:hypothetical protein D3C76_838970 [compost metagenome]